MKRWLYLAPIFAILVATTRGQIPASKPGDVGPGDGGATLRLPGAEPAQPTRPADPINTTPFLPAAPAGPRIAVPPSNQVDINKDIEITDKHSPWVIYAMSYSGPDAPKLAREFAMEMRNNPRLKLNAYVYNYGTAEKLKEFRRVQELKEKQMEALKQAGVQGQVMPLRIRTEKIDESTGVLIDGGFRTREQALAVLKQLRKVPLDADFEKRVSLDVKLVIVEEKDKAKNGATRVGGAEAMYINPFRYAFPAQNPAMKHEANQTPEIDPEDVKLMRKLNDKEKFSLFQVKKPFTLAIKRYNTQQIVVKDQKEADGFLDRFRKGLTLNNGPWEDHAGIHAHNLCDALRKSGLAETYVLHAKYCSFVTVGGYDTVDDEKMARMQNLLESQFRMDAYRPLELLPRPMPMAVPR